MTTLAADRAQWIAAATARIDRERLRSTIVDMVDIPSPTGDERPLAGYLAGRLSDAGLTAAVQPLDDTQANAWGRLAGPGARDGSGDGPALLLYAPIDTFTTGRPEIDQPAIGSPWRPTMAARAGGDGPHVIGLGASNPKGHAACVLVAAEAIAAAGIPLRGELIAAFGAGGMPTNAQPGAARRNVGHGVGCSYFVEQGGWADYAVIAKPGWSISWEEVGLAWFEVTVTGTHTYVGSRHRLPYRNAIADAGRVVALLEEWFVGYAERHASGLVRPQGIVASIEGGWRRMAAATPGVCSFLVDLRLPPGFSPLAARREFEGALRGIGESLPGVRVDSRLVLGIPGSHTPPQSWICRCGIDAWQEINGSVHEPDTATSGATDANILRARGIPTIRVGMPKVLGAEGPLDFTDGMNTVDVDAMEQLTRLLVRIAVDTTTRTRGEAGDAA